MKKILIHIIKLYQKLYSNRKGYSTCRFYPTCSTYAILAIEKYGVVRGLWKAFKRVLRCNPYSKGGYDPLI